VPVKKKIWYEKPWIVEVVDPKSFVYKPSARLVFREDGNLEVLRNQLEVESTLTSSPRNASKI